MPTDMKATLRPASRMGVYNDMSIVFMSCMSFSNSLTSLLYIRYTSLHRYAFGMGGLETIAYDSKEKFLYGMSEQGYVTMIDMANYPEDAPQLPTVIKLEGTKGTFVSVCPDRKLLFVVTKDDPNPGHVLIYKAASRSSDSITPPELLTKVKVG